MTEHVTEITPSRALITATWEDVPHLDEQTKRELLASYPPHMRDARTKGIPSMGAGAIYPVPFDAIACDSFQVPAWFPRGYALDVGWKCTAAVWGAWDRESNILYLTSEYKAERKLPSVHAAAIRSRGAWMTGLIDPAASGASQRDGEQIIEDYRAAGLILEPADNAVEAGLLDVWQRMETGRLKVFRTMRAFEEEQRHYRRRSKDERGVEGTIVKADDHCMDATRYLVMGFKETFRVRPTMGPTATGRPAVADIAAGY